MATEGARRPIAARSSRWAARTSAMLLRLGLTPNQVSCLSVVIALGAGFALAGSSSTVGPWRAALLIAAAAGIQLRLVCNLLDGLMAVEGGMRSATGDLFNDVPDRFADAIILISAGCAARHLDYGLTLGWVAALLAVITAYVRVLGAAGGVGHQFCGPMAKQQRMAIVTVASVAAIIEPRWGIEGQSMRAALALIVAGCVITIARRLWRIAGRLQERSRRQEPAA